MLTMLEQAPSSVRILRREPIHRRTSPPISARRPSLLDPRLRGDAWIQARPDGTLALCFDCWEMASVGGSAVDLPGLNALLHRLRLRRPRR
jgi:hypothetical protein